jgi:hypothetical protein
MFRLPAWEHTGWVLLKVMTCAAGLAVINYNFGLKPKRSVLGLSRDVTYGILWGTLYVLVVHLLFLFVEFPNPVTP